MTSPAGVRNPLGIGVVSDPISRAISIGGAARDWAALRHRSSPPPDCGYFFFSVP